MIMAIEKILISQQASLKNQAYDALSEKYGAVIEFRQFFKVEPLTSREFRAQRINLLDYTAVVFSSRHAIDAYFSLSEELRTKIPETMKYFCTTEAVANYLQKHIVYRKRKIFFGNGTPDSVVALIGPKHKGEKFLIATSESANIDPLTSLFEAAGIEYKTAAFIKSVSQDLSDLALSDYNVVVFYNPADVKSLFENFPDFKQNSLKFISYGKSIVKAMEDVGLEIAIKAPSPDCPSVAKAVELYLEGGK
jgi:uroporphyrinogen-III synthase